MPASTTRRTNEEVIKKMEEIRAIEPLRFRTGERLHHEASALRQGGFVFTMP
jgi:hypothetical protein